MTTRRQLLASLADGIDAVAYAVPPERDGERADRFLQRCVPRLSRARVQAILRAGGAAADGGRVLKPATRVRAGWTITLARAAPDEPPSLEALHVIHEDAALVVVDKPGHLAMHRTASHVLATLTALLARRYGEPAPQPAHRLDRETSGVVVCARHAAALRDLRRQFEGRLVQKYYLAVVEGVPEVDSRTIDLPLMLDPEADVAVTMCVHPDGLPSRTEVSVVRRGAAGRTLLRCVPATGRQHQIRVHLAAMGLPIVGEKLYGADAALFLECLHEGLTPERVARLGHPRHALHAAGVTLAHPIGGAPVSFAAPLPADLEALVDLPALIHRPCVKVTASP